MGSQCSRAQKEEAGEDTISRFVRSSNSLGFKIYPKMCSVTDRNVIFSPTSISTTLAMMHYCGSGQTSAEIKALFPEDLEDREMRLGPKKMDEIHKSDDMSGYLFTSVRALFVPKDTKTKIKNKIAKDVKRLHDVNIQAVDFSEAQFNDKKNGLIARAEDYPEGTLSEMLRQNDHHFNENTSIFVQHMLRFNSIWEKEFDAEQTETQTFTKPNGKKEDVEMMYNLLETGYVKSPELECQIIAVPCANQIAEMFIVLPIDPDGFSALEKQLNQEIVTKLVADCKNEKKTYMLFKFPKITLQGHTRLDDILKNMGVKAAFEPSDVSKITGNKGLFLSGMHHVSEIKIEEKGNKFVAPGEGQMGSCDPSEFLKVLQITVAHPFFFVICDTKTNAIRMMGRIVDPKPA